MSQDTVSLSQLLNSYQPQAYLPSQSDLPTIAQALIAMANSRGGAIVFGLSKSGRPKKLANPQQMQDLIMQAALQCDPPLIIPAPHILQLKNKPVVIATIPPDLPHIYNFEGRYLIWQEDQPVPLRGSALRQLIFARGEAGFEGLLVENATRDDLNWNAVQAYTSAVKGLSHLSAEEALIKRGCLKIEDGDLRPTNAGLLLFGADPQRWLPQSEITVARYTGLQMTDSFTRADIKGTLPEQARQAEAFVMENIQRGVKLSALQRTEEYLYPPSAVREIIVNALAHRDYSVQGDQIRLLLFANRLECYSPGRLPGHVTIKNILQERFSRNAAIVQVLFDMGFIERLGYGIDRIIRSVTELGMPQPEFNEATAGFKVILYSQDQTAHLQDSASMRKWLEMGLNERQISALNFVADTGRISNADYQNLAPNVSPETLRRDLADLVEKNLLLRIGEKRATFYILK